VKERVRRTIQLEPQVLAAAPDGPYRSSFQRASNVRGSDPVEDDVIVVALHRRDPAISSDAFGDASAAFDFGELGHVGRLL
jgi:hypothetical protein